MEPPEKKHLSKFNADRRESLLKPSFAQQRLWFLDQTENLQSAYHIHRMWKLTGSLNVEALRMAFETIISRHKPYRTVFVTEDGEPFQVIRALERFELPLYDLSRTQEKHIANAISREARLESGRSFDLQQDLMIRAKLIRFSETHHVLMTTQHHIASDGWSNMILLKELGILYEAYEYGNPSPLPELSVTYSDYANWQRMHLQGETLNKDLKYWRNQLAGFSPLTLPTDHPRPQETSVRGAEHKIVIEKDLMSELLALSSKNAVTLQMTLLAAFQILLGKYGNQEDVIIAVPTAGRLEEKFHSLIGFFVNTLLLRGDLSGDPEFLQFLERTKEISISAYEHQNVPFEMLVKDLQPERIHNSNPIAQVLFQLIQIPGKITKLGEVQLEQIPYEVSATRFDLEVHLRPTGDCLAGNIIYSTDLFDSETIARIARHYLNLIKEIVTRPEDCLSRLSILSTQERRELLQHSKGQDRTISKPGKCVLDYFDDQVQRHPSEIALIHENKHLSYFDLNQHANQLAGTLRSYGVCSDTPVGVVADRSLEALAGILAILKAGGCYVPLDPSYPQDRLHYILEDSNPPILLVKETSEIELPEYRGRLISIKDVAKETDPSLKEHGSDFVLEKGIDPTSLAYILYTSGTTGRPKGVGMPHQALANLIDWQMTQSTVGVGSKTLQYSSLNFDVSFQEIFSTWCSGGTLVIISQETRMEPALFWNHLFQYRINRLFLPFVALQQLAEAYLEGRTSYLQEIVTAGEQLRITPSIRNLFENLPNSVLYNHYGPTETHVVTAHRLAEAPEDWPLLPPIGKPINNVVIRILDQHKEIVPTGIAGELYIGGVCLAREYVNQTELTNQSFVLDPFGETEGERLYRSGDLARLLPDGSIEFLGRCDSQIKIRGYRVEPVEIATILEKFPGVGECVVIARELKRQNSEESHVDKRLIAYVIPEDARHEPLVNEMKQFLISKLPNYMIPWAIVTLKKLPLSPNGKIDYNALPDPQLENKNPAINRLKPISENESILSEIWSKILDLNDVDIHDDFFELGGHSLKAMQMISRIQKRTGLKIRVRDIFEKPTISKLASLMDEQRR